MIRNLREIKDLYDLKRGDQFTKFDRKLLFTGKQVGNTYQKGINWIGELPQLDLVIIKSSSKEYEDRWIDKEENIYLYYLMIEKRGTKRARINYNSKENRALLEQKTHGANILLTIENKKDRTILDVAGLFEVVTTCQDNPVHKKVDSVLLRRIDDDVNKTKEPFDLNYFEQVVLQPSASRESKNNFEKTIANFINITDIKEFLSKEEFEELSENNNSLGFWGVRNVSPGPWNRLKEGALVLFFANRRAFAAGKLGKKFINKNLAQHLWGRPAGVEPFKYMYSITDVQTIDLPQSKINKSLQYKENFIVQGFQVLNAEKSSILLSDLIELMEGKESIGNRGSGFSTCYVCDRTMISEEISEEGFCHSC